MKKLLMIATFSIFVFVMQAQAMVVNVRTFGAVGDGNCEPSCAAPTDNWQSITNAINALPTSGGTVLFPPGQYLVSNTINVPSNVRLQGTGSNYFCQIRLSTTNKPLFKLSDGATNVTFKDLALYSWNGEKYPRVSDTEVAVIRNENTTGIALQAGTAGISDVVMENVRIMRFTIGVSAIGTVSYADAITDVRIKNYVSEGNEYALFTDTKGADNWDVQNLNVYEMYHQQNGIYLAHSGQMKFLELSCAGEPGRPNTCAILQGNGETYFRDMHVEGPVHGFYMFGAGNPSRVTIENSATAGVVGRATNLVLLNNRFWRNSFDTPRFVFTGGGEYSSVVACANVWTAYPDIVNYTTVTLPDGFGVSGEREAFPGLLSRPQGCSMNALYPVPSFDETFETDGEQPQIEINVTDLCATVGCSGNDYTAAFQAAIDRTVMQPGNPWAPVTRIFVPAGTYNVAGTLLLKGDEVFVGETGSTINYTGHGSLFLIAGQTSPQRVKAVNFRNLTLASSSNYNTVGIELQGESASAEGIGTDFQFHNLNFNDFDKGIWVRPAPGADPNVASPMFDSILVSDAEFSGTNVAIDISSENASNWNLQNIRVINMPSGGEGVILNGPGIVTVQNLDCDGYNSAAACLTIEGQKGTLIDDLTANNVANALVVAENNGYTQFPVTLRNSNLLAGVHFQGRVYLNSVNNIYPARFSKSQTKTVLFGLASETVPVNAQARESDIFSCNDTFTDVNIGYSQSTWTYDFFGAAPKLPNYCSQ